MFYVLCKGDPKLYGNARRRPIIEHFNFFFLIPQKIKKKKKIEKKWFFDSAQAANRIKCIKW